MYEEHIQHTFDSYCKRVLHNAACDYYSTQNHKTAREVYLEDCFEEAFCEDTYFRTWHVYRIYGYEVLLANQDVVEALNKLATDKRDIVLLTCCLGLPDREVAQLIQMARRTVAYKRIHALQELRGYLSDAV